MVSAFYTRDCEIEMLSETDGVHLKSVVAESPDPKMLTLCSVFDLPRLNEKPPVDTLTSVLSWIETKPTPIQGALVGTPLAMNDEDSPGPRPVMRIPNKDITQYLTSIISSQLKWIEDEDQREQVWRLASKRLNERAGRTAMPERVQYYPIFRRNRNWSNEKRWEIQLHEPTLTEDNLGLKTWIASHVLAQRLAHLAPPIRSTRQMVPSQSENDPDRTSHPGTTCKFAQQSTFEYRLNAPYGHVLELGAGTGLAGMTAALDYQTTVWCTDLPSIVPNLERNVKANRGLLRERGGVVHCGVLDWNDPGLISVPATSTFVDRRQSGTHFQIVLAADVLYEPDHPSQIAKAASQWLERTGDARFIAALPKRPGSETDWDKFAHALLECGLTQIQQGEDVGYEDWAISEEEAPPEVTIWWSSWAWTQPVLLNENTIPPSTFSQ